MNQILHFLPNTDWGNCQKTAKLFHVNTVREIEQRKTIVAIPKFCAKLIEEAQEFVRKKNPDRKPTIKKNFTHLPDPVQRYIVDRDWRFEYHICPYIVNYSGQFFDRKDIWVTYGRVGVFVPDKLESYRKEDMSIWFTVDVEY